jgi:hypothetical protein
MDLFAFDSLIPPWQYRLQAEVDSSSDRKLPDESGISTKNEDRNLKIHFRESCDQVKVKSSAKFSLSSSNVPEFSIQPLLPFAFDLAHPVFNKDQEQQQQQHLETESSLTPVEETNEWLKNLCQKRQQKRYR